MTIRLRLTLWYTALSSASPDPLQRHRLFGADRQPAFPVEQSAALQARNIATAVIQQFQGDVVVFRNSADNVFFPQVELFASSVGAQLLDSDGKVLKRSENLGDIPIPAARRHNATHPRG
jgi:hypothetical protein